MKSFPKKGLKLEARHVEATCQNQTYILLGVTKCFQNVGWVYVFLYCQHVCTEQQYESLSINCKSCKSKKPFTFFTVLYVSYCRALKPLPGSVSCGKRPHLLKLEVRDGGVASWQSAKPTIPSAFCGMWAISWTRGRGQGSLAGTQSSERVGIMKGVENYVKGGGDLRLTTTGHKKHYKQVFENESVPRKTRCICCYRDMIEAQVQSLHGNLNIGLQTVTIYSILRLHFVLVLLKHSVAYQTTSGKKIVWRLEII